MKKNIISYICSRSFAALLVGIVMFFGAKDIVAKNIKTLSSAKPPSLRIPEQRGGGPTPAAQTTTPSVPSPGLTLAAQIALDNSATTPSELKEILERYDKLLTDADKKAINERIEKLKKISARKEKEKQRTSLTTQLAQLEEANKKQKKIINKLAASKGLSLPRKSDSPFSSLSSGLFFLAGTSLLGYGALAALPVAVTAYGAHEFWHYWNNATEEEKIKTVIDLLLSQIMDQGRYPTYNAKLNALVSDIVNNNKEISDHILQQAVKRVTVAITKGKDQQYQKNSNLEKEEKDIDNDIIKIRADNGYNEDTLPLYVEKLKNIKVPMTISFARALVSEYLRATNKIIIEKISEATEEEVEDSETEEESLPPTPRSPKNSPLRELWNGYWSSDTQ
jgi:hypothetical protein